MRYPRSTSTATILELMTNIEYYRALEKSDRDGTSTAFVEFSPKSILVARVEMFDQVRPAAESLDSALYRLKMN